jgi:hypothetical protein
MRGGDTSESKSRKVPSSWFSSNVKSMMAASYDMLSLGRSSGLGRKRMERLWCAGALLALTLAAAAKEYVPPSKPPLATLTIHNETRGAILPVTFSNPQKCTGIQMLAKGKIWLGKRMQQSRETVTVPIDASKEFTLYVETTEGYTQGISSCRIIYTFKPGEGREYVATSVSDAESCYLALEREVVDANGAKSLEKDPSARRRELPAIKFGPFGSECLKETPATK